MNPLNPDNNICRCDLREGFKRSKDGTRCIGEWLLPKRVFFNNKTVFIFSLSQRFLSYENMSISLAVYELGTLNLNVRFYNQILRSLCISRIIKTITFIWKICWDNDSSANIVFCEKRTVFQEHSLRKTARNRCHKTSIQVCFLTK